MVVHRKGRDLGSISDTKGTTRCYESEGEGYGPEVNIQNFQV